MVREPDHLRTAWPAPDVKNLSLGALTLFAGLNRDQIRAARGRSSSRWSFEPGQAIVREGDAARLFFVVASGSVSVQLRIPGAGSRVVRLSSMGPGVCFGEMAILDGGKRSADVVADERVRHSRAGNRMATFPAIWRKDLLKALSEPKPLSMATLSTFASSSLISSAWA